MISNSWPNHMTLGLPLPIGTKIPWFWIRNRLWCDDKPRKIFPFPVWLGCLHILRCLKSMPSPNLWAGQTVREWFVTNKPTRLHITSASVNSLMSPAANFRLLKCWPMSLLHSDKVIRQFSLGYLSFLKLQDIFVLYTEKLQRMSSAFCANAILEWKKTFFSDQKCKTVRSYRNKKCKNVKNHSINKCEI